MKPLLQSEAFVRIAAPIAVGVLLIGMWEVGCRHASIPVYLFPKPSDIYVSLLKNGPSLLRALLVTLRVTLQAFAAAVVLGTLIAFMFVQSRAIEISLFPYAVLLQVTPVVAIAPLIIILVKNTQLSLTICATLVALFPMVGVGADRALAFGLAWSGMVTLADLFGGIALLCVDADTPIASKPRGKARAGSR